MECPNAGFRVNPLCPGCAPEEDTNFSEITTEIEGLSGDVRKATLYSGETPQSGRYGLSEIEVERLESGAFRCVLPPASVAGIVFGME